MPIWERWGTPRDVLRDALAGGDAVCFDRLLGAVGTMLRLYDDPGMYAAACAGLACLSALQGNPNGRFWEVAEQALAGDQAAQVRRAHV